MHHIFECLIRPVKLLNKYPSPRSQTAPARAVIRSPRGPPGSPLLNFVNFVQLLLLIFTATSVCNLHTFISADHCEHFVFTLTTCAMYSVSGNLNVTRLHSPKSSPLLSSPCLVLPLRQAQSRSCCRPLRTTARSQSGPCSFTFFCFFTKYVFLSHPDPLILRIA